MHRTQLPRTARIAGAVLLATAVLQPVASFAQCDADTEERLQFIETRLDEGQPRARLWWRSWLGVFTIGAIYGTVGGALDDNNETAIASYITAGKSVLGITQLLVRDYPARKGSGPMQEIPKTSAENCRARLRLAEESLEGASDDADMRRDWVRHLSALLLNLGAGIIVAEALDEPEQGWQDFAISEISSELHIWTYPTALRDDWGQYRTQYFNAPSASNRPAWSFAARRGGIGIIYRF